jgi:hypothetical protein
MLSATNRKIEAASLHVPMKFSSLALSTIFRSNGVTYAMFTRVCRKNAVLFESDFVVKDPKSRRLTLEGSGQRDLELQVKVQISSFSRS